MLFRIFTEYTNKEGIERAANNYFQGYTIFEGVGYWKGSKEKSLLLEVVDKPSKLETIKKLASEIKRINNQEAVLIQTVNNNSLLV